MLFRLKHYLKTPMLGGSEDGLYFFKKYICFCSIAS
jgi:hypothetical protein